MHFTSLILALATATVALSMSTPAKRGGYYTQTFCDLKGATLAPTADYLTYKLVATIEGIAPSLHSFRPSLIVISDCKCACDDTKGCKFVNSTLIPDCQKSHTNFLQPTTMSTARSAVSFWSN